MARMADDQSPNITLQDCLRAAFAATLRGDYAERDRWCAIAQTAFANETDEVPADSAISQEALLLHPVRGRP